MSWLAVVGMIASFWVISTFFPKSSLNKTLSTPIFGEVDDDEDVETIEEHHARTGGKDD